MGELDEVARDRFMRRSLAGRRTGSWGSAHGRPSTTLQLGLDLRVLGAARSVPTATSSFPCSVARPVVERRGWVGVSQASSKRCPAPGTISSLDGPPRSVRARSHTGGQGRAATTRRPSSATCSPSDDRSAS
jgi:hypothetical protein